MGNLLRYIDYELLGTVAMAFAAENVIESIFSQFLAGFLAETVGWLVLFLLLTYLTSEEAEDNEIEDVD